MHRVKDGERSESLEYELEQLKMDRDRLEEDNEALAIRADGVQVLSRLLERSQQEARELKQKLSELSPNDAKLMLDLSGRGAGANAIGASSSSGSLEKSRSETDASTMSSPWNTIDANAMKEVFEEFQSMLAKNKELTSKLEATLKEQARFNGDDGVLVEHLNRLKIELDQYQSRSHRQGDWPRKLRDEADRLKTKLTNIAIQRGTTCGKLQEEIDAVKQKLKDIESRISPGKLESGEDNLEILFGMYSDDKDLLQCLQAEHIPMSPMKSGATRSDPAKEAGKETKPDESSRVVKPRTDVKEMKSTIIKLMEKIKELENGMTSLQSDKNELIKVNHAWDTQYRKLLEHFQNEVKTRDDSFHKLQRELSQEHNQNHASVKDLLEQKDIVIGEQNAKIHKLKEELDKFKADSLQMMQRRLESELEVKYQRAKKLFQDQKKEKEIILQREETAMQECRMLQDAVEVLENESKSLSNRNKMLEGEVRRLANLIEHSQTDRRTGESRSSPPSLLFEGNQDLRRQSSIISTEQIEVLKQQIAIYAEDFKSENLEKEKLAEEVKRLKSRLRQAERDAEESKRQMKIFENDYILEKEQKQLQMRPPRDGYVGQQDIVEPPEYTPQDRTECTPEQLREYQEYCQLVYENNKMTERIARLKDHGVDRIGAMRNGRYFNTGFTPRGAGQPSVPPSQWIPENRQDEMFLGGHVVRDRANPRHVKSADKEKMCASCKREFESVVERFRHQMRCTNDSV